MAIGHTIRRNSVHLDRENAVKLFRTSVVEYLLGGVAIMNDSAGRGITTARVLHWIARLSGTAAVVPLMLIVFGEPGSGPAGVGEWVYLALFPFGFSAGYLIGWRWPLLGGCVSLACMALSLVVLGRVFDWSDYAIWSVLSVPGVLYVIAGLKLRGAAGDSEVPVS